MCGKVVKIERLR